MVGFLLLGKKNYYFIFVASFLLLLYKLAVEFKKEWVQTIVKYGIILSACLLIYDGVTISDSVKYSGHKAEIVETLRNIQVEKEEDDDINLGKQTGKRGILVGANMR